MATQILTTPPGVNASGLPRRRLLRVAGPCRVLTTPEVVDLAHAAILARPAVPFAYRPCAPIADTRSVGELLEAIDRGIAWQAAAATRGGTHAPA